MTPDQLSEDLPTDGIAEHTARPSVGRLVLRPRRYRRRCILGAPFLDHGVSNRGAELAETLATASEEL